MSVTVRLGRYEVKFSKKDLWIPCVATLVITGAVIGIVSYQKKSQVQDISSRASSYDDHTFREPDDGVDIKQLTAPSPISARQSGTAPRSEPAKSPQSNTLECNNIVDQYQPQLKDLDTQIQAQLDTMNNIINSSQLMTGDLLHQAEMTQNFDGAEKKAEELTAQYGTLKEAYQNKLLSAGCTQILKQLLN